MQYLKVPPHNLEIEQVVLGSMLLNPKCVPVVRQLLTPDDFYKESHILIYAAITSIDTVDALLVSEQLRKQDQLEKVGEAINSDVLRVITYKSEEWIAEAEADVELIA